MYIHTYISQCIVHIYYAYVIVVFVSQFPILSALVITSAHLPLYACSLQLLCPAASGVKRLFSLRCCHGNSQSVPGKDLQVCPLHSCQAPVVHTQIHEHTYNYTHIQIQIHAV